MKYFCIDFHNFVINVEYGGHNSNIDPLDRSILVPRIERVLM